MFLYNQVHMQFFLALSLSLNMHIHTHTVPGLPTPPSTVHSQLKWILSDPHPPASHSLCFLTSLERDHWADVRDELLKSEQNSHSLDAIDSSMFVLSLDDKDVTDPTSGTHTFLHNYGVDRWFDKSFSLHVTSNGVAAVTFEHAWGDGVAVLRFFNEVYRDTIKRPYVPSKGVEPSREGVERLDFDLSERAKTAIEVGRSEMEKKGQSLRVNTLRYDRFGKNLLKRKQLSPDAILQLAFQVCDLWLSCTLYSHLEVGLGDSVVFFNDILTMSIDCSRPSSFQDGLMNGSEQSGASRRDEASS